MASLKCPLLHISATKPLVQIFKYCSSPSLSSATLPYLPGHTRSPQDGATKGVVLDPAGGFQDPVPELRLVRVGHYLNHHCWPREAQV